MGPSWKGLRACEREGSESFPRTAHGGKLQVLWPARYVLHPHTLCGTQRAVQLAQGRHKDSVAGVGGVRISELDFRKVGDLLLYPKLGKQMRQSQQTLPACDGNLFLLGLLGLVPLSLPSGHAFAP